MSKKILTVILAVVMLLGIVPAQVFAASTEAEALGEVNIYSDGVKLNYLVVNGSVREQTYTYYNYVNANGQTKEIPAYCVNPNQWGVPQKAPIGTGVKYLANSKSSDPKAIGIVANGYPTKGLGELGLQNKYEAYYATKTALWCHIISGWNITSLRVNPNLTGADKAAAERVLAAAKQIYSYGTGWTEVLSPEISCTPDKDLAYSVTVNGQQYKQQIFNFHSKTFVAGYKVNVAFADAASVPAGTKIVDMDNNEISTITVSGSGSNFNGQFKILYPAASVEGQSGSVQLSFTMTVYGYAIFYAECQEVDKYGNLQNYLVDTDPTTVARLSAISKYASEGTPQTPTTPEEPDNPDTGIEISKFETGTNKPLGGARFAVIDPEGATVGLFVTDENGKIMLPVTLCGNYTIIETDPPQYHLLSTSNKINVTVEYGKIAKASFFNEPYGNLIVEKYSDSGERLSGAVVTVKHIESGATYTKTTSAAGSAEFDQLKPGAYEVVEVTAPAGYQKDIQTHTTTVVSGETVYFSLINKELPGLRILKYDRKTGEVMPDVSFEIKRDTVSIGTFKTGLLGEIVLTDLQPGTYTVHEVNVDGTHILDTTPQNIELKAGEGIKELTFFNDVKPGMRLIKIDSQDPSKVISGAVFEVKSVDGSFGPKEYTTDANGEIDLSALPAGAYVVTEKQCDGYIIDQAQRIIQLDPNEDAQFIFTNTVKPSIQIIKLSSDSKPLAGVTFRIAKIEDGSHYLDRTTNANGEIVIAGLEEGVYSVRETATVQDHILNVKEYHVQLFSGKTSTLVVENYKRPNLTIYKTDADTGEPVPGVVFQVKAADGHSIDEVKTGADGKAVLNNLLPGVYEISEKSVPAAYLKDAPSQLITLHADRDFSVYFENHKKPGLTIEKLDSITGNPVKGAKFSVIWASSQTATGEATDLGTYYTDENGLIEIEKLNDGWLKVTELEPAAGYAIKEPAVQETFIKGGESKHLVFENTPLSALVVWKFDSKTGKAIEGAVFQLKYLAGTSGTGGTVIGTYKTSANGAFTVTGLKAGTYIVEELASDDGHVIDTAPQTVLLSGKDQDVVSVFFGNAPKGSVLVKKSDAIIHEALSGVEFFVTRADGSVLGNANGKFVTDSKGTFLVDGLDPGTSVVVRETKAKDGYVLDDAAQTVTVKPGETVSLEFLNQPFGSLLVKKVDAVTGEPLSDVEFIVTDAKGSFLGNETGTFKTDSKGSFVVNGLAPGTVAMVKETKAKDGYILDDTVQSVTIESGRQTVLEFRNQPLGSLLVKKVDAKTGEVLSGVEFSVTDKDGVAIGKFTTDAEGTFLVSGLTPGETVIVKETKAKEGYILDETAQTAVIKSGESVTLEFMNQPMGGILVKKVDAANGKPLSDVEFLVRKTDGTLIGNAEGKFVTDINGTFTITGLEPGTSLVVKETRAKDGYMLDDTAQTAVIKSGETVTLEFRNKPLGNLIINKLSSSDKKPLEGVTFQITYADGSYVDKQGGKISSKGLYYTDKNGQIILSDITGTVVVTEIKSIKGYTIHEETRTQTVQVNPDDTQVLTFYNDPVSGIIIHKIDSVSGEGIYGVKFLVYDEDRNPIGEYTSDQDGYVWVDDLPGGGRYYIRELEAEGYNVDAELKTVYVKDGKTSEITWKNTPITGQIQVLKYAYEDNSITGIKAGTPLAGAVYEIVRERSGKVVGYITTDARGVAASKALPLGRYIVREVQAPAYWQVDGKSYDVTLEYPGQIIKLSSFDKAAELKVTLTKTGVKEILAGARSTYYFTVANESNVDLERFYLHDKLPYDVSNAASVTTGTYNQRLIYRILYRTNMSDYRVLAANLLSTQNYSFALNAVSLEKGEYITDIYFDFGTVPAGFRNIAKPSISVSVSPKTINGYRLTNRADAGGYYVGTWESANASWSTIVRNLIPVINIPLPKTGY